MNNWQKWYAGLNPTKPASVLAVHPPPATLNTNGICITWPSVSGKFYILQRGTNLTQPFTVINSNIFGLAGTTSSTDTTAANNGPYYYRVGVQ